ncbi:3-deoxy-7-phosphoheptulonate synthase [Basidiobolus ranarum]|uniref:Phospho-2-dehydro-3-deoxyheptonate aldolase n=1 Tax=Basidiobolus ranarum TaxID=34480 RepID=A0ABR2WQR6_9FUNG
MAFEQTDDLRITGYDPLLPPQIIQQEHALSEEARKTVQLGRTKATAVLKGEDDKVLVVVGPCSIHDVEAAKEYALKLKKAAEQYEDDLVIVMRAYFEKPRTTVGWKGLINDPFLDGSFQINKGLRIARQLLIDITSMGVPVGSELLDTISPQFLADLISWGAIGARTTECQLHRELASGVSFPVGFKNGTDGNAGIALDAIRAASHPHHFLGVTKQGLAAITNTSGNDTCHIILRGGNQGPNYEKDHVARIRAELRKTKLKEVMMVDCSHGNSLKLHTNQPKVCSDLAKQIASGDNSIVGLMIESNLVAGKQDIPKEGPETLTYGQSVTDACVDWECTETMLEELAQAVQQRRSLRANGNH